MGACEMMSCQLFEVFENTLQRLLMIFGDWLVGYGDEVIGYL